MYKGEEGRKAYEEANPVSKSVDSFRLSAELQCDKELTMLKNENAALKAQVHELRDIASSVTWYDWSDNDDDAVYAIDKLRDAIDSNKSPQACLNDHNARIEEEVIGRCAIFLNSEDYEGVLTDIERKYTGDK